MLSKRLLLILIIASSVQVLTFYEATSLALRRSDPGNMEAYYQAWARLFSNTQNVYRLSPSGEYAHYLCSVPFTVVPSFLAFLPFTAVALLWRVAYILMIFLSLVILFKIFKSNGVRVLLTVMLLILPLPVNLSTEQKMPWEWLPHRLTMYLSPFHFINYFWGQTNGFTILLFIFALYFLHKKRLRTACLFYALSVIKPATILTFPLFLMVSPSKKTFFYSVTFLLLLNLPLLLYPPWLFGAIELLTSEKHGIISTITELHNFVWIYNLPLVTILYANLYAEEGVR